MAITYKAIATVTVGSGGASSIDFTSIPATYSDIVIKLSLRSNSVSSGSLSRLKMQVNSITSGYSTRLIYNLSGSASSASTTTDYITYFYQTGTSATASTFSNSEIYIPNYAGSSNKSFSIDSTTENNGADIIQALSAGLLTNTAAITSLSISDTNAFTFGQYSTATLYGIKNS